MKKIISGLSAFAIVLLASFLAPYNAGAAGKAPEILVDGHWLAAHGKAIVVDVRPGKDYMAGHIPGAINIPLSSLQGGPDMVPYPVKKEEKTLGTDGLTIGSDVVLYGNWISAFREFWILDYLGMRNIHVLDGGIENWKGETSTEKARFNPAKFTARPVLSKYATTAYVRAHLKKPGVILLDARTPAEYHGIVAMALRGGHIPGAININFEENFQKKSTLFKPAGELKRLYTGLNRKKEIIVYCQNGSRAVVSYFALKLLGFKKVRTYIPSWVEWGSNLSLPVDDVSWFNFVPVIKMLKAEKK